MIWEEQEREKIKRRGCSYGSVADAANQYLRIETRPESDSGKTAVHGHDREMHQVAQDEAGFEKMDTQSAKSSFEKRVQITENALDVLNQYTPEKNPCSPVWKEMS